MLSYILVLIAVVLLACDFSVVKFFQKTEGSDSVTGLKFNAILGLFTAVLFFFIGGCRFTASWFSILMAALTSLFCASYTQIGFKILQRGNLALYTFFLMSGGMILPYLFGVFFLDEELNLLRAAGLVIFTVAILLAGDTKLSIDKKGLLLCFAVFVLNGGCSIVSKFHQIDPLSNAVDSKEFVMLTGLWRAIFSTIMLLSTPRSKEKTTGFSKKTILIIVASAGFSGLSYLLQLIGAVDLPATVLYPLITGGSMIFTAIAGRVIFKVKITKKQAISIGLCLAGTLLFL